MKLKNIIGVTVGLILASSCTEKTNEYFIQGKIAGVEQGVVYLKKYEDKNFIDTDSALVSNGQFIFKGSVSEPLLYGITTDKDSKQPLLFFLENSKIDLQLDENVKKIDISGSSANDIYVQNAPLVSQDHYKLDSLVRAHPSSPVGAYFLIRNFAWRLNLNEIQTLRTEFDKTLNGSFYINQIDSLIAKLEKLKVGSVAPDFILPNLDNNPISLSSFRGKYVLVDFWASWCPDCRKENPNIVSAYEQFKTKNFAILGVSLDRKREPWIAAIEKDNLTWTHVSDLNGWQSEVARDYAIRWIPTSYLLDPNGIIIAVGLTGNDLINTLEKVLN